MRPPNGVIFVVGATTKFGIFVGGEDKAIWDLGLGDFKFQIVDFRFQIGGRRKDRE